MLLTVLSFVASFPKTRRPKKRQQPSFHIIFMPDVSSTSDFFLIIFSAAGSDQAQCLLLWNQSLHPFLLFSAVCHRSPVGADHISVDILSPRQSVRETGQTPSRRRHYNDSCLRRRFQRAYSSAVIWLLLFSRYIHIHCSRRIFSLVSYLLTPATLQYQLSDTVSLSPDPSDSPPPDSQSFPH